MYNFLIVMLTGLFLSSCGVKGDLYLPDHKPGKHHKQEDNTDNGPVGSETTINNSPNVNTGNTNNNTRDTNK